FQVGIGAIAVTELYERLFEMPLEKLDIERCVATWPGEREVEEEIGRLFPEQAIANKARVEMAAKRINREALREHLRRAKEACAVLKEKLQRQLYPRQQLVSMLAKVGAAVESERIGISKEKLTLSVRQAYHIRRRYTVLDLAARVGMLDD